MKHRLTLLTALLLSALATLHAADTFLVGLAPLAAQPHTWEAAE
jgi:hypothetical protein